MKKVLVIGSTVADIIINVDYLPTTAQDIHIKSQTLALGGCAYNVSDMIRHFIIPYTQCDSIENAAKALYRKTENTVIVTNGANGAFFFDGEDFIHVPPVPAVKVVDTIGAGDAHMGAVIACLEKGMSLYDSIAKANAASSLIVARKGGTISDEDFVQEGLLDFE